MMIVCLAKKVMLMLISILFITGLFFVESCVAPVTTPAHPSAAPEISVEIHHDPRVIPPQYSTNPYTGETQQIHPAIINPAGNITLTIKNRSFTTYTDKNGNAINVYYVFFIKPETKSWDKVSSPQYAEYQSNSDYTTITFPYGVGFGGNMRTYHLWTPDGLVWDFRVQAVTGYFTPGYEEIPQFGSFEIVYVDPVYEGEGSAFTEFTITLPDKDKPETTKPTISLPPSVSSSVDSSNPPQQNQQQTFLTITVIIFVCIIVSLLIVILYQCKQGSQHSIGATMTTQQQSTQVTELYTIGTVNDNPVSISAQFDWMAM